MCDDDDKSNRDYKEHQRVQFSTHVARAQIGEERTQVEMGSMQD